MRFNGRIVANPNRSGVVQSTIQGRYEAPEGGVPPLGTRVKAGDLLGQRRAVVRLHRLLRHGADAGHLDQEIALDRAQARAPGAAAAQQRRGARRRWRTRASSSRGSRSAASELLAARVRPEELRAPVDGVIAATRVVAGQVVAPERPAVPDHRSGAACWSRRWCSTRSIPTPSTRPPPRVGGDATIKLKFIGRSRALQQQYSLMQFQIVETQRAL